MDLEKEKKARQKSDKTIESYESLFQAKNYYDSEELTKAGECLEKVDGDLLSEDGKKLYDSIHTEVMNALLMKDYNAALELYWSEDWGTSIEAFKAIVDQNKSFNDCQAAFYLGDSYLENGSPERAKTWLSYAAENTSSSSVSAKANRKLRVANGEPEYEEDYSDSDSNYDEESDGGNSYDGEDTGNEDSEGE